MKLTYKSTLTFMITSSEDENGQDFVENTSKQDAPSYKSTAILSCPPITFTLQSSNLVYKCLVYPLSLKIRNITFTNIFPVQPMITGGDKY